MKKPAIRFQQHNGTMLAVLVALLMATRGAAQTQPSLKEVFKKDFLVGAALNYPQILGLDGRGDSLVRQQFNAITPENCLKWESVHPRPETYSFEVPDKYVAFGEKNGMAIIGHTLVWHHQTPRWVFDSANGKPVDREILLRRMHDHIATVVGRYKGRIKGWDVVNEAVDEDGSLRQSPWLKIIGEDFIVKAFQFAHEADPNAELYYNDYSLENAPKRKGALALVKKLQESGVHVAAVGLQGHYKLVWPSPAQVETTITAFAALGVKVVVTELDIDVVPASQGNEGADLLLNNKDMRRADFYAAGLPDSMQQVLARRYTGLFAVFVRNAEAVDRVTFWGVGDGNSWLNSGGRVNYPLLFDRKYQPKPAFDAVLKTGMK